MDSREEKIHNILKSLIDKGFILLKEIDHTLRIVKTVNMCNSVIELTSSCHIPTDIDNELNIKFLLNYSSVTLANTANICRCLLESNLKHTPNFNVSIDVGTLTIEYIQTYAFKITKFSNVEYWGRGFILLVRTIIPNVGYLIKLLIKLTTNLCNIKSIEEVTLSTLLLNIDNNEHCGLRLFYNGIPVLTYTGQDMCCVTLSGSKLESLQKNSIYTYIKDPIEVSLGSIRDIHRTLSLFKDTDKITLERTLKLTDKCDLIFKRVDCNICIFLRYGQIFSYLTYIGINYIDYTTYSMRSINTLNRWILEELTEKVCGSLYMLSHFRENPDFYLSLEADELPSVLFNEYLHRYIITLPIEYKSDACEFRAVCTSYIDKLNNNLYNIFSILSNYHSTDLLEMSVCIHNKNYRFIVEEGVIAICFKNRKSITLTNELESTLLMYI